MFIVITVKELYPVSTQ